MSEESEGELSLGNLKRKETGRKRKTTRGLGKAGRRGGGRNETV